MDQDTTTLDVLALRAAAGDRSAFTTLVETTAGEVQAFVAARASSLAMVDEVVQGTYVTAFQCLADYRPEGSLLPWLKGIARHRLLEEQRRWQSRRLRPLEVIAEAAAAEPAGAGEERLVRLRVCLDRLPAAWRAALCARYWDDEAVTDIARRQKTSPGAISQLLFRARSALQTCIGAGHG
jgi:RNA polymerase sigma factor (sigma-70 family)